jgi:nitrite reductase/ring-hydroxylating ferredoxin subunit
MGEKLSVARKNEISAGQGVSVDVKGKRIALFNVGGEFYAIDDECSHAGGSLAEGTLNGHVVMCPLHGAEFDVKTGQALSEPAEEAVKGYKVFVEGDDIKIEV